MNKYLKKKRNVHPAHEVVNQFIVQNQIDGYRSHDEILRDGNRMVHSRLRRDGLLPLQIGQEHDPNVVTVDKNGTASYLPPKKRPPSGPDHDASTTATPVS